MANGDRIDESFNCPFQMEMHNNPNIKKSSLRGDEMTLKEPHR